MSSTVKPMFNKESKDNDFKINVDSFSMLIDHFTNMYENPAKATMREVLSNAGDATRNFYNGTGVKNKIVVELPTLANSKNIVIRDFGYGMTMDTINNVVKVYGESTKSSNDDSTGHYGFGFKAPLSLVPHFDVVTVNNGHMISFSVIKVENNPPKMINIKETEKHNHNSENGTSIFIPVSGLNDREILDAFQTIREFEGFFLEFDVEVKNKETSIYANTWASVFHSTKELKDSYVHLFEFTHKGKNIRVFNNILFGVGYSDVEYLNVMGSISLNLSCFLINGYIYGDLKTSRYIIQVEPGVLNFPPSRDSIVKDGKLSELIDDVDSKGKEFLNGENLAMVFAEYLTLIKSPTAKISTLKNKDIPVSFIKEILSKDGEDRVAGGKIDLSKDKDFLNALINLDGRKFPVLAYEFSYNKVVGFNPVSYDRRKTLLRASQFSSEVKSKFSEKDSLGEMDLEVLLDIFIHSRQHTYSENEKGNTVLLFNKFNNRSGSLRAAIPKFDLKDKESPFRKKTIAFFNVPSEKDASFSKLIEVLSAYTQCYFFEFEEVKDVPRIKTETRNKDEETIYSINSFDKDILFGDAYNNDLTFLENVVLTNNKDFNLTSFSLFTPSASQERRPWRQKVCTHRDIVEDAKNGSHVVIVPKNLIDNYFGRILLHVLSSVSIERGDNFLADKKVIVIEEPYQSLVKNLEDEKVDFSVFKLGEKDKFTKKSLTSKAKELTLDKKMIDIYFDKADVETIVNNYHSLTRTPRYFSKKELNTFSEKCKEIKLFVDKNPDKYSSVIETINFVLDDIEEEDKIIGISYNEKVEFTKKYSNSFFTSALLKVFNSQPEINIHEVHREKFGVKESFLKTLSYMPEEFLNFVNNTVKTILFYSKENSGISEEQLEPFVHVLNGKLKEVVEKM